MLAISKQSILSYNKKVSICEESKFMAKSQVSSSTLNQSFRDCLSELFAYGIDTKPRGQKVTEIINYSIVIDNPRNRIITFPERKTSMKYLFGEFIWYLSGSPSVQDINLYSKFWDAIAKEDGSVNSNYGTRIFGHSKLYPFNQWNKAKEILTNDKDSRQAVIRINHADDYTYPNKDVPCTLTMQFFIRNDELHLIVNMRSNDIWRGYCNDQFQFTMLQELMMLELRTIYPNLKLGKYYHNAASMHLYEMHFESAQKIVNNRSPIQEFYMPEMRIDEDSVENLIKFEKHWRIIQGMDPKKIIENEYYLKLNDYWRQLIHLFFIAK
jgi:thymidylate synthase